MDKDYRTGKKGIGTDEGLILGGLEKKQSLVETLDWWRGPWCGQVPFFRPITSYLFWLEYKGFGTKRFHLWLYVTILSHLLAMVLGFLVLKQFFNSSLMASLTIGLFAGPIIRCYVPLPEELFRGNIIIVGGTSRFVLLWKNSPEPWLAIFAFSAILCFLYQRYWVALVFHFLAIGTKEAGFALLPTFALISWHKKQPAPRWFWAGSALMTVSLLVYRHVVLGGVGYRLGSNRSWYLRALMYYGGVIGRQICYENYPVLIAGVGTGLAILLIAMRGRTPLTQGKLRRWRVPIVLGIFVSSWLIGAYVGQVRSLAPSSQVEPVSFDVALLAILYEGWQLTNVVVTLLLVAAALRYYPKECLLCYGLMVVFSAGLYTAAQPREHAWYLADIFRTALLWWGLFGVGRYLSVSFHPSHPPPSDSKALCL